MCRNLGKKIDAQTRISGANSDLPIASLQLSESTLSQVLQTAQPRY